jgi:hypothetical protein
MFGIVCNVSVVVFITYQDYHAGAELRQPSDWGIAILVVAISLMPSLALLAFGRQKRVVLTYASILFLILIWRVQYRYEDLHKWDGPGVVLLFLGMISAATLLVRAALSFFALTRR